MRRNAVAYEPIPPPTGPRKRGRPRRYGEKIKLRELFESASEPWQEAPSPVYGERDVTIRFLSRDLRWRPLRRLMRFVLVIHPTRGRCIFICTDLTLAALEIICGYGSYRAKVRRKIAAYHLHIQVGLIAQGLLQYIAFKYPGDVWSSFGSWLRTIREGLCPSELVAAAALRNALPGFLADSAQASDFQKFLRDNIDPELSQPLRFAG